jgi:hypothetical protein
MGNIGSHEDLTSGWDEHQETAQIEDVRYNRTGQEVSFQADGTALILWSPCLLVDACTWCQASEHLGPPMQFVSKRDGKPAPTFQPDSFVCKQPDILEVRSVAEFVNECHLITFRKTK